MKKNKRSKILDKKILYFNKSNYDSQKNTTNYLNSNDKLKSDKSNLITFFDNYKNNYKFNINNTKIFTYLSNIKNFSSNKNSYKTRIKKINLKNFNSIIETSHHRNKAYKSLDIHKISYNKNNLRFIKSRFPLADKENIFSKISVSPHKNNTSLEENNKKRNEEIKKVLFHYYYKKIKLNLENLIKLQKQTLYYNEHKKNNIKEKNKFSRTVKNMKLYLSNNKQLNNLPNKRTKNFIKKKMPISLNNTIRCYSLDNEFIRKNKENNYNKNIIFYNNNIFNNQEIKKYFNTTQGFPNVYRKEKNKYKSIQITNNKSYIKGIDNLINNDITLNNYSFSNQNNKIKSIISRRNHESNKIINNN